MQTWRLGVGLRDKPFGFWGVGTRGLLELGGQPFKFEGLGHGNFGFRGGTWGQPFRLGAGLGDTPPGFGTRELGV